MNGILTKDNDMIVSTFNDFFINSVRELAQGIPTEIIPSIPIDKAKPIFKISEISESEVRKIITSLKNWKMAEKWVAEQLKNHLNLGHTPLHPMQFGFRTNQSTETANCFLLENIMSKLDKGGIVGAVFLDSVSGP